MKLFADHLHFLGDTPKEQAKDSCVHGTPVLELDGVLITDGEDWCVSASAFRFLQTLSENHFCGGEEQMFPCCGHFLIPSEDLQTVSIGGCPNGIDFDIIHENGNVRIRVGGVCHTVPYKEYREAVLSYARQIEEFFHKNPPREFDDSYDKNGFTAFCNQWHAMKEKALNVSFSFEDESMYSAKDILSYSASGIYLPFYLVKFGECAYWYRREMGGDGTCVGQRDDETMEITFYTAPHPLTICFQAEKKTRKNLFRRASNKVSYQRFLEDLASFGYTTAPIS